MVLATGGTIAGRAGSATRREYRPGQIDVADLLRQAEALGLPARLDGVQIANMGSENIGPEQWRALHEAIAQAIADDTVAGIVVTHGTDTAEETALLLDLTLPATKPVVLVGAMRPADAVGSDGLRNFANAARVAADPAGAGRGVLLVMSDRVISARDARKARTTGPDAFRGFPRDAIASATPEALEWFGEPWRQDRTARHAFPQAWPDVPILHLHAGIAPADIAPLLARAPAGLVVAGFGEGNMPDPVRAALAAFARETSAAIVRASRVDEGLVDRDSEDAANGFVAARALNPAKARILLQVLLANGIGDPDTIQTAFDTR